MPVRGSTLQRTRPSRRRPVVIAFAIATLSLALQSSRAAGGAPPDEPKPATHHVILVTTDGLRWQEVFRGADDSLMNHEDGGVEDVASLRQQFWRETPEERRSALMPFLWSTVSKQGQIFGNRDKHSLDQVTNGMNFSYPGYNELFTGLADPRINSNDKRPNPNINVFEWLDAKPAYHGKVAAVGSWDVYPYILNVERSKLPVNAGWMAIPGHPLTRNERLLNDLMSRSIHEWDNCRNDVFTFRVGLEYLRHKRPRVMYLGLGDTDEYAHAGRYDLYLRAAHEADAAIKGLWNEIQSRTQYRGTTTLIVTTDHGRGDPPRNWRSHGEKFPGSEAIWMAIIGPDTPPLGERARCKPVTQARMAATIAALLGENYLADFPKAGIPIPDVMHPIPGAAPASPTPVEAAPLTPVETAP